MKLEQATRLVRQFEDCTLPKEEWTNTAHFVMALWYCIQLSLPRAVEKIRHGIRTYNVSVGGQNTDSSGYHETITLFYIMRVADYLVTTGVSELTEETLAAFLQQPFLEKHYILNFYEKNDLMSPAARAKWMPASMLIAAER